MGDAAALADGAEDVDLVLVSADLARRGFGGVVGAVAVPGAGFGFGLRVVGVDGTAHGLAVDGDGVVGVAGDDHLEGLRDGGGAALFAPRVATGTDETGVGECRPRSTRDPMKLPSAA